MTPISMCLVGIVTAPRQESAAHALLAFHKCASEITTDLPDADPDVYGVTMHGGNRRKAMAIHSRRLDALHEYLRRHGPLRARTIRQRFGLSSETTRLDLLTLEREGRAVRDSVPEYEWSAA